MKTILLVEDERAIRDFIAFNLKSAGYSVVEAETGEEAIEIFDSSSKEIQVVLLDIMLPAKNGFEVCEYIRKSNQHIGIIFLTAKALEADKLYGLNGGADDYITKPFSTAELIARVDAVFRRVCLSTASNENASDTLTCGEFKLDLIRHSLTAAGNNIELTQIEFQILECFFRNKGQLLSRKFLLDKVWGVPYYGDDKVVDVNIRRLRVKIEKEPSNPVHLITVWGKGYIFK